MSTTTMRVTIAEPDSATATVATRTRELLKAWADSLNIPVPEPLELPKEDRLSLKTEGREKFTEAFHTAIERGAPALAALCQAFLRASNVARSWCDEDEAPDNNYVRLSYFFEGMLNAASKLRHEHGLVLSDMSPTHPGTHRVLAHYPSQTTVMQDQGIEALLDAGGQRRTGAYGFWGAMVVHDAVMTAQANGFRGADEALPLARIGNTLAIPYIEGGEAWVAGFLSPRDTNTWRFTRRRMAAWLADSGMYSETAARDIVEKIKTVNADAEFVMHPNDIPFGKLYALSDDNSGSCMSGPSSRWDGLWDDRHPTDAYSSSFFGCGDNQLVLMTSMHGGEVTGRAVCRITANGIRAVRWYGNHSHRRAAERFGLVIRDGALEYSWLALVENPDGISFLHPYVDGEFGYGQIDHDNGRVLLEEYDEDESGDQVCLHETEGHSVLPGVDAVFCSDVGRLLHRHQAVYQPISRSHRSKNEPGENGSDDWRCGVTGEHVVEWRRAWMYVNSEHTHVCDVVQNEPARLGKLVRAPEPRRRELRKRFSAYSFWETQTYFDEHPVCEPENQAQQESTSPRPSLARAAAPRQTVVSTPRSGLAYNPFPFRHFPVSSTMAELWQAQSLDLSTGTSQASSDSCSDSADPMAVLVSDLQPMPSSPASEAPGMNQLLTGTVTGRSSFEGLSQRTLTPPPVPSQPTSTPCTEQTAPSLWLSPEIPTASSF